MAEGTERDQLNPEQYLGVVRAALDPDERKFFKAYMGQDAPDIGDFLRPTGRFAQARQLREHINRTVLDQAIQQSQAPTVAEAQTMYPGFPTPPQAYKATPQAPLQSNEMPVLQDTQQVQIPSRMQGPMPGVMTALGEQNKRLTDDNVNALTDQQYLGYREKDSENYMEQPRPMQTIQVGQYGPDQAPSQATVMDPMTKLPPSFRAELGARQHQTASRQPQPHYPSADEIKYKNAVELGVLAWKEQHPNQEPTAQDLYQIQQIAAGGYEKPAVPNTPKARIENAKAIQEEATAGNIKTKLADDSAHTQAQTKELEAKTAETRLLMDTKLKELLSRIDLHKAQGNVLAGKAELAEFREKLGIDNLKWKVIHSLLLMDDLDKESKLVGIKSLIENDPNLQVRAQDPSFLGSLFGQTSGSGIKIEPRQGGGVQAPKIPSAGGPPQPLTPAPAPPEDDAGALRALGLSMKDGDVKDYKGQKYRRKGGKLEKVK